MNELFSDIVPIPDCQFLIDLERFKSPSEVAREMLRECRRWRKEHTRQDVLSIITPEWQGYIKQNL